MFSRATAVVVSALAVLAAATPNPDNAKRWGVPTTSATVTTTITVTAPAPTVTTVSQCNTAPIQCCEQVVEGDSDAATAILGLLGIVLTDLDVLLGLNCSPITIIGVGTGNECSATPVCCENNSVGGLISIGCIPIIL